MIRRTPFTTTGPSLRNGTPSLLGVDEGDLVNTVCGLKARLRELHTTAEWDLLDDAVGRFQINSTTGVLTLAQTILRPSGMRSLAYLPFDLYDGGQCPVVETQTGVRYVDPLNGDDSASGTTLLAPWKSLRNKSVSNAIIYLIGEGSITMPSIGAGLHFMGTSTIVNCTIRPLGETPIRLVETSDYARCAFAIRYNDGTYSDITFYKIEVEGWQQGFLVTRVAGLRWLRCGFINTGDITAGAANLYHGIYMGGTGATDWEIAYCYGSNIRAYRAGAFLHFYGSGAGSNPGPQDGAIHHCYTVPTSKYSWGILLDAATPINIDIFNNTLAAEFNSGGPIGLTNSASFGGFADSTVRFRSNIVWNQTAGTWTVYSIAGGTPTWGGTNTGYGGNGYGASLSVGDWGVNRDPSIDSNGIAQAVAEQGSGDTLADLPIHTDLGLRIPSSFTNVDRGHYQHGPAQFSPSKYGVTVKDLTSAATRRFGIPVAA